jgi:hypothetical protein
MTLAGTGCGFDGYPRVTVINLQNFGLCRKGLERKLYWAVRSYKSTTNEFETTYVLQLSKGGTAPSPAQHP